MTDHDLFYGCLPGCTQCTTNQLHIKPPYSYPLVKGGCAIGIILPFLRCIWSFYMQENTVLCLTCKHSKLVGLYLTGKQKANLIRISEPISRIMTVSDFSAPASLGRRFLPPLFSFNIFEETVWRWACYSDKQKRRTWITRKWYPAACQAKPTILQ